MASEIFEVDYDRDTDAQNIRRSLEQLVKDAGKYRVFVFRSVGQHLRALVVSDQFQNVPASERQHYVWNHLKTSASPNTLQRLFGVHPYSWSEYDQEFVERN